MNESIKKYTEYCLNCKVKPCSVKGCPLNNDIPTFIRLTEEEKLEEAYEVLCNTTVLPAICGRICPHQRQCMGSCVRGIKGEPVNIGEIEAYIADNALKDKESLKKVFDKTSENIESGKSVAVIGSGPSGLTCAAFLRKYGFKVTIYEKYNELGGILRRGIPSFRLNKDILDKTIGQILNLGIDVKYNMELGNNITLEELRKKYDAIFIAIGANISSYMGIEGEDLDGVYGGNELLEYKKYPDFKGKKVAVIGGGNVAMDCARTVKKLGASKVNVIYRRAREQMPAEKKEIEDAIKEGINFMFQNNIVKIMGSNHVCETELIKTELIQKEGDTRLSPVNVEGSNYKIKTDYIIMALGSKPEEFVKDLGLNLNKWGNIKVDENYRTSNPKIYAGGDLAGDKGTVAWAARAGREAAETIKKELM